MSVNAGRELKDCKSQIWIHYLKSAIHEELKHSYLQSWIFTVHVSRNLKEFRRRRVCFILMGLGFIGLNMYISIIIVQQNTSENKETKYFLLRKYSYIWKYYFRKSSFYCTEQNNQNFGMFLLLYSSLFLLEIE